MRIAIVNDVWPAGVTDPEEALARMPTLTGWATAIRDAGASLVTVHQRFAVRARFDRADVGYEFWSDAETFRVALSKIAPDVVHVNGLDSGTLTVGLRRLLSSRTSLVVQDHGGFDPLAVSFLRRRRIRSGLKVADVLMVASERQIDTFALSGLVPPGVAIRDCMEGSSMLHMGRPAVARPPHPLPLGILWVGRLTANKDPLTVVRGVALFARRCPNLHLTMVGSGELEADVRSEIDRTPELCGRVQMTGALSQSALAPIYESSDLFVLGSRREGSGYAVLEALAFGVIPVVTDIAPFVTMTDGGRLGANWRAGDPQSLRDALMRAASVPLDDSRRACRQFFDGRFSWQAIGRRAMGIYRDISRG
jgi:glycosyltransferase involved in cell wall biosynthesis